MIFATDLDRTMIYSKKFLEGIDPDIIQCVEPADGRNISYMTKRSIGLLEDISKKIRVIPTTARTIAEFQRVEAFKNMEYAITTCGGVILKNGKVLEEWEKIVNREISPLLKEFEVICDALDKQSFIIRKPSLLDGKAIFTKTDNSEKCKQFLDKILEKDKWNVFIERKKVYILPWIVQKRHALSFLKQYLNENKVISAGDAPIDMGMILYADKSYIPKHGSIMEDGNITLYDSVSIVPGEGIFAGQAILEKIQEIA